MKLVSIPANPVPEGAVTATIKTPDGVSLRYARWEPPPGRKGTVVVCPGRTEFIEKYFEVVRDLRARGLTAAILDWRGQGLSDRPLADAHKSHVRDFSDYLRDLETFMNEVVLPDCPPPYFALGHSMGANVLIHSASLGHRWFDRTVLSAPMIGLPPSNHMRFMPTIARLSRLLGFGSRYVPGGSAAVESLSAFVGNRVTSDPVRHARTAAVIEAEPALGLGSPTIAWADAAFRAMAPFADPAFPARIRHPILIVAAGRDLLVSTPAIEEFAIRLRAGAHLVISGARHEILMEQDYYRQQFWAAFDAFVPGTPLFG
ncbi:alpha/beta hydrolase [Xanthobacteraceae bacterium Astr-EGSB]|uniref:alpha/beta hydrolase n=1 Tax=Astrobacterium formosum TaxID=3069710 RepID=UPI0027AF76D8|nr:alpha/beta hydrolase [Xanthobacteraceae bacterium Astr-EGSB]